MMLPLDFLETLVNLFKSFGEVVEYPPGDERLFHTFFRGTLVIALREGPFLNLTCRDDKIMGHIRELVNLLAESENSEKSE